MNQAELQGLYALKSVSRCSQTDTHDLCPETRHPVRRGSYPPAPRFRWQAGIRLTQTDTPGLQPWFMERLVLFGSFSFNDKGAPVRNRIVFRKLNTAASPKDPEASHSTCQEKRGRNLLSKKQPLLHNAAWSRQYFDEAQKMSHHDGFHFFAIMRRSSHPDQRKGHG